MMNWHGMQLDNDVWEEVDEIFNEHAADYADDEDPPCPLNLFEDAFEIYLENEGYSDRKIQKFFTEVEKVFQMYQAWKEQKGDK